VCIIIYIYIHTYSADYLSFLFILIIFYILLFCGAGFLLFRASFQIGLDFAACIKTISSTPTVSTMSGGMKGDTAESIPVKYNFRGSLRRSNIGFPPKMSHLRKKLAKSFPDAAHLFTKSDTPLRVVYTDDEGDEISITTNEELLVAYRLAQDAGKVLRFKVPEPDNAVVEDAGKVEAIATDPLPTATVVTADAADATDVQEPAAPTPKAVFATVTSENLPQRIVEAIVAGVPVHFGYVCRDTGESPIIGARYSSRSGNENLSENAFSKLPEAEMAEWEEAAVDGSQMMRLPRFVKAHARWMGVRVHRGVMCDVTGMLPIIGNRYQLIGKDYDICQYGYDQLSEDEKKKYRLVEGFSGFHPGPHGFCPARQFRGDWRSAAKGWRGMPHPRHHPFGPFGGKFSFGGKWQPQHPPPHYPAHPAHPAFPGHVGYGASAPVHFGVTCDASGMCPIRGNRWHKVGENYDLCQAEFDKLPDSEKPLFELIAVPRPFCGRWGGPYFGPAFGTGCFPRPGVSEAKNGNAAGKAKKNRPKAPTAKFVKDLTVNDLSRKAPGEKFEKGWVMRAGPRGIPAGTSLVFVGGHDLGAQDLRVPVGSPVKEGVEFVLKIGFQAPTKAGHYRSFWRLQTAEGRRFGPRIWADIMVANSGPSSYTMKFMEDVTIPDGATVVAGQPFRKTWLVSTESGWRNECVLKCMDVWSSFVGLSEAVPAVPKGSQMEISITLTAPEDIGLHRTYFGLVDGDGNPFGDVVYAEFNCVPAATKQEASNSEEEVESKQEVESADPGDAAGVDVDGVEPPEGGDSSTPKTPDPQVVWTAISQLSAEHAEEASKLFFEALGSGDFGPVAVELAKYNVHLDLGQ